MEKGRRKIRVVRTDDSLFLCGIPRRAIGFADFISRVLDEAMILATIQREETCLERFSTPGRGTGLTRRGEKRAYYLMEMPQYLGYTTPTPIPFRRVIGFCGNLFRILFDEPLGINMCRIKAGEILEIPAGSPFGLRKILIVLYLALYKARDEEFADTVFERLVEEIPDCGFFPPANLELIIASYFNPCAFRALFPGEARGEERRMA